MATQMKCPNCGSTELIQVDNDQFECPYCGKSCTRAEAEVAVIKAAKAETAKNVKKGISKVVIGATALAALFIVAIVGCNMKKEGDAKAYAESPEGKAEAAALAAQEEFDAVTAMPVEQLSVTLQEGPSCMMANTFESFYAKNVIDGKKGTAWGRDSYAGSNGTFVFALSTRRLDHINIWNGKWSGDGAWGDNAKVKEMKISKADASGVVTELGSFVLDNKAEMLTISFPVDAVEARDIETLTIEVSGKYGGSLFQDLYLSELEFYGVK